MNLKSSALKPKVQHARSSVSSSAKSSRTVQLFDFHDRLVPYEKGWAWQKSLVDRALIGPTSTDEFNAASSLLILQHPPVYTLGAGSSASNILFDTGLSQVQVHRTERGGEVTYHGPGQIVLYPILDLKDHDKDLHSYMRQLEEVVIKALEEASGIQGEREPGLTGVWVRGNKVAAIGIRAKRWVTFHGLALNVVTDLSPFDLIVPCGIKDRAVTSVRQLLEEESMCQDPFLSETALSGKETGVQSSEELMKEYRYALLEAFQQVFDVELVEAKDKFELLDL